MITHPLRYVTELGGRVGSHCIDAVDPTGSSATDGSVDLRAGIAVETSARVRQPARRHNVVDLMAALQQSLRGAARHPLRQRRRPGPQSAGGKCCCSRYRQESVGRKGRRDRTRSTSRASWTPSIVPSDLDQISPMRVLVRPEQAGRVRRVSLRT